MGDAPYIFAHLHESLQKFQNRLAYILFSYIVYRRLGRLISDMLLLATTENADMPLNLTSTDVSTMLIGLYETHLPLCRETRHILQLDLPDELLPEITIDESRIIQVLSILISNAISYSPAGSKITLSIDTDNRNAPAKKALRIEVIDRGIGIPETV